MKMLSVRACASLLLLSLAMAAPVDKGADVLDNVNEVQNQEEELQSLLELADEKGARNDVTVHEEHVQHVHEINGKKVEVDTARKTVSDTATGEVLSDVKQEVSKADESAGAGKPEEVEVKTEVDVPEDGVHETIVQSGTEEEEPAMTLMEPSEGDDDLEEEEGDEGEQGGEGEVEEEMEFSPEVVADFLYRTGDFNRFYSALAQLVNASIMTEEEAQSYSQLVALEYARLQMDYENSILVQRRAPSVLEQDPVAMEGPSGPYPDTLPVDSQEGFALESPEAYYALDQIPRERLELDPYDLISALWNEAYGTGDVRAQALVGELFDRVRSDNDPDDEGQVRDVLLDLLATVMGEEEQPQQPMYGWQPIMEDDTAALQAMQPMEQPLPDQPMDEEEEDEEAANELLNQSQKRADEQPITNKDETNPAPSQNEQPMESSKTAADAQPAQSQPAAQSESQPSKGEQSAASAPVPTQKRAAETV